MDGNDKRYQDVFYCSATMIGDLIDDGTKIFYFKCISAIKFLVCMIVIINVARTVRIDWFEPKATYWA